METQEFEREVDAAVEEVSFSKIRRSPSIAKLIGALAEASLEFSEVPKDTKNPFYKSTYADLSALIKATRPALGKHGLVVSQFPFMNGAHATVITLLAHSSGEWIETDLTLPVAKADAQGGGSAITYARRYSYQSILNVAGEADDDGNAASGKKPEAEDRFYERTGQERATPALVAAFEAMFKNSGKTSAQLAVILQSRYKAASPSELTKDELTELVKWVASKEPLQDTLKTSVDAAREQAASPQRTVVAKIEGEDKTVSIVGVLGSLEQREKGTKKWLGIKMADGLELSDWHTDHETTLKPYLGKEVEFLARVSSANGKTFYGVETIELQATL